MKDFDSKEDVIDFWEGQDPCSQEGNRPESFYSRLTVDTIRSVVDLTGKQRILDAGSGWGRLAKHFQSDGDVVGLDITDGLLRAQQKVAPNATQVRGDAGQLPFRSNSFDLVYAARMLHYFDDYTPFLSEFMRVTRPGGTVAVIQPNSWNPYHRLTYYTRLLSPTDVSSSFKTVGFTDVDTVHFGFSHPSMPIPALEHVGRVPLIRRISGLYLVYGRT
ncbi:class I SAM-dependent methyltransferase [Salinigranum sp. GCM10025319]|uniref:class I SAM-dependent methyltransferase n=1 Tax=Salinigranum sp. GCM10025319 TaxID=3252687 RepID=UPI0036100AAA